VPLNVTRSHRSFVGDPGSARLQPFDPTLPTGAEPVVGKLNRPRYRSRILSDRKYVRDIQPKSYDIDGDGHVTSNDIKMATRLDNEQWGERAPQGSSSNPF